MTLFRVTLAAALLALAAATPAVGHATDVSALYQASYDLESVQDYAGALSRMDEIGRAGEDYVFHLRRGWLLYLLGRYADSAEAYRAAIADQPESVEARQGLVLPLMALKKWPDARAACEELLSVSPDDYRGNSRLAYVLYSMGRYGEAARLYRKVLTHYPSDVEMQAGLGWAQLKQGDVAAAKKTFSAVLRVAPSHISAKQGLDEAS